MKINHVKISNILGIDELEFTPAGFTAITGKNGKGKTSVLEAIKSATGKGHDATLLRKGAEKGEVVLVFDNGMEIHERVTPAGTKRDVIQDGKKVGKPADVIKSLTDSLSVNPVEFLNADSKSRVKVLLESMPIDLDVEHLAEISGLPVRASSDIHPLALIDHVRQQVYDHRTGTNRAVKEKDGTINQLTLALPEAPGGVEGDEDELRAKLEEASSTREAEAKRIDEKLAGIQRQTDKQIAGLKQIAEEEIAKIRAKLVEDVEAAREELRVIEGKANKQREMNNHRFMDAAAPLREALAVIKGSRDAVAKREQSKKIIEQMVDELEGLKEDAQRQTEAIDAIDAYKSELLASMPIPGLTVQDGEVYRDGVPFDRLNTQQQVQIAFQIAALRAGDLKVVCLDGLELLDSEHLAELERQAEESGLQVFLTRVSDSEFNISAS